MQIPSSFLALLALIPSIATGNPVAQQIKGSTLPAPTPISEAQPTATPDFSRCIFAAIVYDTIEGPFSLTALNNTIPPWAGWVFLRSNSANEPPEPYITPARPEPPYFTLNKGVLKTSQPGNEVSAHFAPSSGSGGFERFFLGGSGSEKPSEFAIKLSCDAEGNPYNELLAGEQSTLPFFV